jgi:hypothetical protein
MLHLCATAGRSTAVGGDPRNRVAYRAGNTAADIHGAAAILLGSSDIGATSKRTCRGATEQPENTPVIHVS